MRLALKVVVQNDGDFVDVILLYLLNMRLCESQTWQDILEKG